MDLNNLFEMTFDELVPAEPTKKSTDLYAPHAKEGKDNTYKSLIRFVPNLKDPNKSIISKWNVWLENPVTGEKRYVDCPSSVGKPSIIQDLFFKLRNSESAADQKLSENFSRRPIYYSYIQVIKDTVNPDNDGKIMIFKFGTKIYEKIRAFGKPDELRETAGNPFDLLNANAFLLDIRFVGGFNNYDNSGFSTKTVPLTIDGEPVTNDREIWLPRIAKFAEEMPDIYKYGYHDWSPDVQEFVLNVIKNTNMSGKVTEQIFKKHNISNNSGKTKTVEIDSSEDSFDDIMDRPKKTASNIPPTPSSTKELDDIGIEGIDDDDSFDPYEGI